jgi:hypothetical protein
MIVFSSKNICIFIYLNMLKEKDGEKRDLINVDAKGETGK